MGWKKGDVIVESQPYAHVLSQKQRGTRCDACFACAENLKKCTACVFLHYCSRACQNTPWNKGLTLESEESESASPPKILRTVTRMSAEDFSLVTKSRLDGTGLSTPDCDVNSTSVQLLRPTAATKQDLKQESSKDDLEGMPLADNVNMAVAWNIALQLHCLTSTDCDDPQLQIAKERKWGACLKLTQKCVMCDFIAPEMKLYKEIKTGKPGPNPAAPNIGLVLGLQEHLLEIRQWNRQSSKGVGAVMWKVQWLPDLTTLAQGQFQQCCRAEFNPDMFPSTIRTYKLEAKKALSQDKKDWQLHKDECPCLKRVAPKLPTDSVRLLLRLFIRLQRGDGEKTEWDSVNWRPFVQLETHSREIIQDEKRSDLLAQATFTLREMVGSSVSLPEGGDLVDVFGRMVINTFSICDGEMQPVGSGVYLSPSLLDHSCLPNAVAVFTGTTLSVRCVTDIPSDQPAQVLISYIDQLAPSGERRRQLDEQYYFTCRCRRCTEADMLLATLLLHLEDFTAFCVINGFQVLQDLPFITKDTIDEFPGPFLDLQSRLFKQTLEFALQTREVEQGLMDGPDMFAYVTHAVVELGALEGAGGVQMGNVVELVLAHHTDDTHGKDHMSSSALRILMNTKTVMNLLQDALMLGAVCPQSTCDGTLLYDGEVFSACQGCAWACSDKAYWSQVQTVMEESQTALQTLDDLKKSGDRETRLQVCKELLGRQRVLSPFNVYRVKTLDQAMDACIDSQLWEQAVEFGQQTVQPYMKLHPPGSPTVGIQLVKLGKLQLYLRRLQAARTSLQQAESILRVTHGKSHEVYQELSELLYQCVTEMEHSEG
ncbi:uncharacterized protein LOC124148945 [Haliotis rufescens]|uniref:uncharacterized protein LOC124148945 n=1 Tax=Haliotis rufescens TaxID=6454 RepID=UPI00201EE7A7|nr:uncharacterized protein LOC124148945 [Haliotis rufescens]